MAVDLQRRGFCASVPGIAALTFALLMSARMGIFQEMLYKQFGKHSKEALFYNVSRHVVFYWADGTSGRVPSPPTLFSAQRLTCWKAGGVKCALTQICEAGSPGWEVGWVHPINITSSLFSPARITTPWISPPCPQHLPACSPLQPVW